MSRDELINRALDEYEDMAFDAQCWRELVKVLANLGGGLGDALRHDMQKAHDLAKNTMRKRKASATIDPGVQK